MIVTRTTNKKHEKGETMKNYFLGVFMTLAIVFGGYIAYNEYKAYFQPKIVPIPMIPIPTNPDTPTPPLDRAV